MVTEETPVYCCNITVKYWRIANFEETYREVLENDDLRELEQNDEAKDDEQVATPEIGHIVLKPDLDVRAPFNDGVTRSRPEEGASLVRSEIIATEGRYSFV